MTADLFEPYSVMLVASLNLDEVSFVNDGLIVLLIVTGIGVITAVLGTLLASPRRGC